jgi:hypothetical protein
LAWRLEDAWCETPRLGRLVMKMHALKTLGLAWLDALKKREAVVL